MSGPANFFCQRETKGIPDLRIAALVGAINKVAGSQVEMGIFP